MIYSVYVSEFTLDKEPSLVSKVRQDNHGYVMKRNVVAFEGRYKVYVPATDFFGGEDSRPYVSKVLVNPTWGVLYNCAKRSMKCTNDAHHVFFEGAYKGVSWPSWLWTRRLWGKISPDDVTILHLALGS